MNYTITDIRRCQDYRTIGEQPYYFVDANIWIDHLGDAIGDGPPENWKIPYMKFFEKVIEIHLLNSAEAEHKPRFVINASLLNEIITNYLNKKAKFSYYMRKMNYTNPSAVTAKLKDYRKDKGTDYPVQLQKIVRRILDYSKYVVILTEGEKEFGGKVIPSLLNEFSATIQCDFNDFFYYRICKERDIPIVTMDGDFAFKQTKVITNHPQLLALMKA